MKKTRLSLSIRLLGPGLALGLALGCAGVGAPPAPAPDTHAAASEAPAASRGLTSGATEPAGPYVLLHTVEQGQSLSEIARLRGVSVAELARTNGIENPDLIRVGQEIRILIDAPATQELSARTPD